MRAHCNGHIFPVGVEDSKQNDQLGWFHFAVPEITLTLINVFILLTFAYFVPSVPERSILYAWLLGI